MNPFCNDVDFSHENLHLFTQTFHLGAIKFKAVLQVAEAIVHRGVGGGHGVVEGYKNPGCQGLENFTGNLSSSSGGRD